MCCVFHPTQLLLATGGDDSQVRVWDLVAKTCVATLQAHFSAVTSLSISPDGWTLFSGGRDGVVVAWSLRDYSKLATVPVYEAVEGVVALPSAALGAPSSALCFATGGEKGITKLWRSDTGKCVFDTPPPEAGPPTAAGGIVELRAMPAGGGVVAATQDCRLLFLRAGGDKKLTLERQFIGNNDEVTDLRFLSIIDGDCGDGGATNIAAPTHVAAATNSEHLRVFDASTLSCAATLAGHTEAILCLDAAKAVNSTTTTFLASGSKDNSVRVWAPLVNSGCIAVGTGHVGAVSAVAFARRGGGFLVSGGADKLLKVWDVSCIDATAVKPVALKATAAVAAHTKDINAVAVAPNDSLVATASQDRTVKIWTLPNLVLSLTLKGHKRGVWSVAFSPVDKAVATASGDKTVKLWSLTDGACLRTFEGHVASVLRVDFLSSGTQLLTAGGDGLLKLWNLRTSECVNTFDAHEDKVWALALGGRSGGEVAASGGADGSIIIWEDCTEADASEAARDHESVLLREQQLSNAMHGRQWKKAAALAFEMRHPGKLLTVVNTAYEGGAQVGEQILRTVVADLDQDRLKQCLEYCREWNTNGRTCFAAQVTLGAVLRTHSPAVLAAIPGVAALLEAIESYTKRHFARTDRMVRSTFVVDYILGNMKVLTPVMDDDVDDVLNDDDGQVANGHADLGEVSSDDDDDGEEDGGDGDELTTMMTTTTTTVVAVEKKSVTTTKKKNTSMKERRKAAAAAVSMVVEEEEEVPKTASKKRKSGSRK